MHMVRAQRPHMEPADHMHSAPTVPSLLHFSHPPAKSQKEGEAMGTAGLQEDILAPPPHLPALMYRQNKPPRFPGRQFGLQRTRRPNSAAPRMSPCCPRLPSRGPGDQFRQCRAFSNRSTRTPHRGHPSHSAREDSLVWCFWAPAPEPFCMGLHPSSATVK